MSPKNGIVVPSLPLQRPARKRRRSLVHGFGAVVSPEGDVIWQEDDWTQNALHDAGELSMLNVYLKETATPTPKYLALLNDGSIAETDGTMAAVTESKTPATDTYNRQPIAGADWTDQGLQGGDYRFEATAETFGPITGTQLVATHAALTTTLTSTAGLLLLTLALSATTTVAVNQSFIYTLRWAQQ